MEYNIKLIQTLIDEANKLPYGDKMKLDALRRRAEMIIKNTKFKDSNKYLLDLKTIDFFPEYVPDYYHMPDDFGTPSREVDISDLYKEAWELGKRQMVNLFNIMSEELRLFGNGDEVVGKRFALASRQLPTAFERAQKYALTGVRPRLGGQPNKVSKIEVDKSTLSKRMFIVHGHDEEMKEAVARIIEKIGLSAIILHKQPNKGRTIIEKFTEYADVSFAIVLLSPDDLAYSKGETPTEAKLRARQDVIFELGFFVGKLGRENVAVLYQEEKNFEMPSDYSGVLYIPYDKSGQWKFDLVKELKACGYDVDANKLL